MSESEEASDRGFRRIVQESREQMQAARSDYFSNKLAGNVSLRVRHQLARAARQYYDALWEYRDRNPSIEAAWEESDVEYIEMLSNDTVYVDVDPPGDAPGNTSEERNALVAAEPEFVLRLTKQLDKIANEMGFAATTKEATPRTEITDQMIEEVEEWREANLE
jgi:hypothetical protein